MLEDHWLLILALEETKKKPVDAMLAEAEEAEKAARDTEALLASLNLGDDETDLR